MDSKGQKKHVMAAWVPCPCVGSRTWGHCGTPHRTKTIAPSRKTCLTGYNGKKRMKRRQSPHNHWTEG